MRKAFVETLLEVAKREKNFYLLTGDLGFSFFEEFKKRFPERFINCGVAEQNMIGVAAGLALNGKKVVVYSIIPFITYRCLEQIRNDICFENLDVKIIGVGGGFSYGNQGFTHHALEDLAIMRSLPNMTILCPADSLETRVATKAGLLNKGPLYLRLEKEEGEIHRSRKSVVQFQIGKANLVKKGKDVTIIGIGSILRAVLEAVEKLEKEKNISVRIISMVSLKPLDKEIVLKAAQETRAILTIEEHSIVGGLGSAIGEVLFELNQRVLFKRLAIPDKFFQIVGSQEYLRRINNFSIIKIKKEIEKLWRLKINTR